MELLALVATMRVDPQKEQSDRCLRCDWAKASAASTPVLSLSIGKSDILRLPRGLICYYRRYFYPNHPSHKHQSINHQTEAQPIPISPQMRLTHAILMSFYI